MTSPSSSPTSSPSYLQHVKDKGHEKGDKYKTELCQRFFSDGWCKYGRQCRFAHGDHELRPLKVQTNKYKYEWCRNVIQGMTCPYGSRCQFRHFEDQIDPSSSQAVSNRLPHPPSEHQAINQEGFSLFSTPIEEQG
jgi:hypothetical protein